MIYLILERNQLSANWQSKSANWIMKIDGEIRSTPYEKLARWRRSGDLTRKKGREWMILKIQLLNHKNTATVLTQFEKRTTQPDQTG